MSTSQNTSVKLNIAQNSPDFELEPLDQQSIIFKKGLFSKTLDPPKESLELLENYRTVTVKCLYSGCR